MSEKSCLTDPQPHCAREALCWWRFGFVLLTGLALALSAGLPANAQADPPQDAEEIAAPQSNVVVERQTDDDALRSRILRILEASDWFANLSVDVREGIVFLDGRAASEGHVDWARSVAARTEEVVAVINRIEVREAVSWDFSPAWRETERLVRKAQQSTPLLLLALVVLIIAWQLSRLTASLARWLLRDRIASPLMLTVATRALAIPVFLLGLYLVLQITGLTRLAITVLGGTGLAGIVLGFAFRDIAENFLASLLLSMRNPFSAGDLIRLDEHEGIVRNLNTRSTVLLTADGNHVQIPNAVVFKSVITNFSSNPSRRSSFVVGIGYDDATSNAQEIIDGVLARHPAVRDEPAPFVVVDELAASTVKLRVYFWFDSSIYSPAKLSSALMRQSKQALLDGGVSMPDEAREVIFPNGLPIYRAEPADTKKMATVTGPARTAAPEADTSSAEGGLDREDDDVIREAGAHATPEEVENLLGPSPGQRAT